MAAREGHDQVVKFLLGIKAGMEMVDFMGRSPLHEAAANGHLNVVKLLCAAGCNPMLVDKPQILRMKMHIENPMERGVLYLNIEGGGRRLTVRSLHLRSQKSFNEAKCEALKKVFQEHKADFYSQEINNNPELIKKIILLCDCKPEGVLPIDLVRRYQQKKMRMQVRQLKLRIFWQMRCSSMLKSIR